VEIEMDICSIGVGSRTILYSGHVKFVQTMELSRLPRSAISSSSLPMPQHPAQRARPFVGVEISFKFRSRIEIVVAVPQQRAMHR
jgi:hypothetical protein